MNNAITLGELFKKAGYETMWSGKHHSTELPTARGFDHYSGLFEEDDAGRVCQKQSGNMPPSYVSDTNIKMERPPSLREYE